MVYVQPVYTLEMWDRRSLAFIGEVPAFSSCTWNRHELELGSFELVASLPSIGNGISDRRAAKNNLFVIKRDRLDGMGPQIEFAGIVRRRKYNEFARTWTLGGPDLKWFLTLRYTLPPPLMDADTVSSMASANAMLHYINANLISPTVFARRIQTALREGMTFTAGSTGNPGPIVSYSARNQRLLDVLIDLARAGQNPESVGGGVYHDVQIVVDNAGNPAGYMYLVRPTTSSDVLFSTQWRDVKAAEYSEDFSDVPSVIYALGNGAGGGRSQLAVVDSGSDDADFYIEHMLDARQATTPGQMTSIGQTEIARLKNNATSVTGLQPLLASSAHYRTEYDVGMDVDFGIDEIDVLTRLRLAGIGVSLKPNAAEDIKLTLGVSTISIERSLAGIVRRSLPVQVA